MSASEYDDTNIIKTPTSTDVLCGRGAPINKHTGNRTFRTVVKFNKPLHNVCDKRERYQLAESIVKVLEGQTPPTRFLQRYPGSSYGEEKWVPISKERATRKALQALREKESEEDEESSPDELIEILSGEFFSKKSFFEQDKRSDWNNVVRHLLPQPHQSLASHSSLPSTESDDEYSIAHKKRKTSLGPTISSPGNYCNVASSHKECFDQDVSASREELYGTKITRPDKSSKLLEEQTPKEVQLEEITIGRSQEVEPSPKICEDDNSKYPYIDFDMYMASEDSDEKLENVQLNLFISELVCPDTKQMEHDTAEIIYDQGDDAHDHRSMFDKCASFGSLCCLSIS